MKGAIEQELDCLVETRMVEKVSHAGWAAPIVAVPKWDGTVDLCGDYKVMANKELDIDQYPLPCPEDLMTYLTGDRNFPSWTYQRRTSKCYLIRVTSIHHRKYPQGTIPLYPVTFRNSICFGRFPESGGHNTARHSRHNLLWHLGDWS